MKKKLMAGLLAFTLVLSGTTTVWAGEVAKEPTTKEETAIENGEVTDGVAKDVVTGETKDATTEIGNDAVTENVKDTEEKSIGNVAQEDTDGVDVEAGTVSMQNNDAAGEVNSDSEVGEEGTAREAVAELPINEENFPDEEFRKYVIHIDLDRNGTLSQREIDSETQISQLGTPGVRNYKGIEYFTNLRILRVSTTTEELDLSKNTKLEYLQIYNCETLTHLDINTNLKELRMERVGLTNLDISKLVELEHLWVVDMPLKSLDVSQNTKLTWLFCRGCQLSSLDVSQNAQLEELSCPDNLIKSLELGEKAKLIDMDCSKNQLTSLDVSKCPKLEALWCSDNQLASLDVSQNKELMEVVCYNNNITTFDLANNDNLLWIGETEGKADGWKPGNRDVLDHGGGRVGCWLSSQYVTANTYFKDGAWMVDLASIVGSENLDKVRIETEGVKLSADGIVAFSGAGAPKELVYIYDTENPKPLQVIDENRLFYERFLEDALMTVKVTLNAVKDETENNVAANMDGLDLNGIYQNNNVDSNADNVEVILSQTAPAQADSEKLTQQAGAQGYSVKAVYEILLSLYGNGEKIADLTENFGKLTLTLQAGADFAGREAVVYQLHNGSEIIVHDGLTVSVDGTVTITVDRLSTFAVSVKDEAKTPVINDATNNSQNNGNGMTNPSQPTNSSANNLKSTSNPGAIQTGDDASIALMFVVWMVAAGAIAVLVKRRYFKKI